MISFIKDGFAGFKNKIENGELTVSEIILGALVLLLAGMIIGMFISPKDVRIGCDNGTTYIDGIDTSEDDEDYDEE